MAATSTYTLTCSGSGGTQAQSVIVIVSQPPTANAGANQTVASGDTVTLDGSASSDPENTPLQYSWTQTAGPAVSLSSATVARPSFAAPTVTVSTVLTFELSVTDADSIVSAPDSVDITVLPGASGNVTISGQIRYERIPFSTTAGTGLNYASPQPEVSRGIQLEVVSSATQAVLATTSTNASGNFQATVPASTNVFLRAIAQMVRDASQPLPHWRFEVRDLPPTDTIPSPLPALYTHAGTPFNSSAAGSKDLLIPSGFDASGQVTGTRAAAPFAVLDTVYRAYNAILAVDALADFPPLILDWGPSNAGGVTFFTVVSGTPKIVLAAQVGLDTDEYDAHVIAHEFGHYIEQYFSRSDSIGGPHGLGDQLDPRVAFGEGFGYAFAAYVLGDPVARDSFVQSGQQRDGHFDIEGNSWTNPGWYSEASSWSILWDVFDGNNDGADTLSLGLQPIWNVLTGPQAQTDAVTSIFSFVAALKQQRPSDAAAINQIVAAQSIAAATIDAFASTETNAGNPSNANVLPVFTPISVGGGPVSVRSIGDFGAGGNKLASHRFLRLSVAAPTNVRVVLTSTTPGSQASRDSDIVIYRRGSVIDFGIEFGNEDFTTSLTAGEYVLDVYDCENAECSDQASYNYAPTDIVVTLTAN